MRMRKQGSLVALLTSWMVMMKAPSCVDAFQPTPRLVIHRPLSTRRSLTNQFTLTSPRRHYLGGATAATTTTTAVCAGATASTSTTTTALHSLRPLVEEICAQVETASLKQTPPPTIFVGGKGGVGKTSISSALAVYLATENNLPTDLKKILIVSTDPAHSLGDALDEDLRRGRGQPVPVTGLAALGGGEPKLYACEVDAAAALQDFSDNLASAFDLNRLADALGVSSAVLEGLGLDQFTALLNSPPPGLDELVALSNVLDDQNEDRYDVVVVDTAPTGHTLRLLALPQFLDGLLGRLIRLRLKLTGLASTLQSFLGDTGAAQRQQTLDTAVERLETFRSKMARMKDRLTSSEETRFVVATIATKLAVAESTRLIQELGQQDVSVTDVVVNQCVVSFGSDDASSAEKDPASSEALQRYYDRRKAGQDKWMEKLKQTVDEVSFSEEYQSNGQASDRIEITKVPFFDVELVGVPALGYVGAQCLTSNPNFAHLMDPNDKDDDEPKVVICGGKGGVGKTTTSSSLAVSMAAKGHRVALISTDPAHSLGDAIDIDLKPAAGKLVECPLIGVPGNNGEGSLSVLEVDPASAIKSFKGVVNQLMGDDDGDNGSSSNLRSTLKDLQEIFDTLPAGTDEVVALAKIINLVRKGNFDRIVLDTAPTGHTLRMLGTPTFLADLIERILRIDEKINANAAVRMFISASARGQEVESAAAQARSTLLSFQLQMYDLEDLFSDAERTEFLIVTVPTELAVRESVRLLNDLTFESQDLPIKVRNVVVNQVLGDDERDVETFLSHLRQSQQRSMEQLQGSFTANNASSGPPRLTTVPYLDTEPRGVFGLKALADQLMRHDDS